MHITISAIGKYKREPLAEVMAEYGKRLPWKIDIKEFDVKSGASDDTLKEKEAQLLLKAIPESSYVIALDERGKALSSRDFAKLLQEKEQNGQQVTFLIGGADGLSDSAKTRSNTLISFGIQTWPHKLVRIMLMEQLYRAYTILTNHPYHRD